VSFRAGELDLYEGGFLDYVQMLDRRQAAKASAERSGGRRATGASQGQESSPAPDSPDSGEPTSGAEKHRVRREAARRLERQRRRVTELERAIAKREQELAELRQKLQASPAEDWERLHEWATQERELSEAVERLMSEWARVSDELATLDGLPEAGQ
jgi:chromosome segregation ATPase